MYIAVSMMCWTTAQTHTGTFDRRGEGAGTNIQTLEKIFRVSSMYKTRIHSSLALSKTKEGMIRMVSELYSTIDFCVLWLRIELVGTRPLKAVVRLQANWDLSKGWSSVTDRRHLRRHRMLSLDESECNRFVHRQLKLASLSKFEPKTVSTCLCGNTGT